MLPVSDRSIANGATIKKKEQEKDQDERERFGSEDQDEDMEKRNSDKIRSIIPDFPEEEGSPIGGMLGSRLSTVSSEDEEEPDWRQSMLTSSDRHSVRASTMERNGDRSTKVGSSWLPALATQMGE